MTAAPAASSGPDATAARSVVVLYAPSDEPFVRGFLLPGLGSAQPIDARDLATVALDELDRMLQSARVAVAVFSPEFLANPWTRLSELLASTAALESTLTVVPVVLADCALPLHVRNRVQLDFRSHDDWDSQLQRLRDYLARPAPTEPELPCPYPGMRPFEAADARYFYGRDAEVASVIALIGGGEREIALIGPSGSGKSSLISAGVLPRLAAQPGGELIVRTMRPGDAPVRRLAGCLGAETADAAAVAGWAAAHPGARLVVFVDQLEELFALAPPGERDGFAQALEALRKEPRCLLILAVRADFYAQLMQSALWLDGSPRHVDLLPLRGAGLRAAIEQPARALEVYFEAGLIDRLLADAAGEPGVLPLLQETLVQLWRHRRRQLLTIAAYDALGEDGRSGLAVAISSRADRCLADMTPAQAAIARRLLLRLVSFGVGRPNTRRRQSRAQLYAGEPAAALDEVLRLLTGARLVTVDGDGRSGDEQVDLCHEVLITAWPPFAAWVETRRADELRRRQILATADQWTARGRGASGLLDDGELAAAIAWRQTDAAQELGESAQVTALIDASRTSLSRTRRRRRGWIVGGCVVLLLVAVGMSLLAIEASDQATVAKQQSAEVVRRLGEQYREVGRQAVVEGRFERALPYLVAARKLGIDDPALRLLFKTATRSAVTLSLHHGEVIAAVSFSPDEQRIVTGSLDGTVRIWDATTGAALGPPLVHPKPVFYVEIRGDGARLLTISTDNTARIWDLTNPAAPPIALHHAGPINAASFSIDGTVVLTASDDQTAQRWDVRTGAALGAPLRHSARVINALLSADGTRIATMAASENTVAGIWDAMTSAPIAPLLRNPHAHMASDRELHEALLHSLAINRDGTRIVSASEDGTARVWDLATAQPIGKPLVHEHGVMNAELSPDGSRIATVDTQQRVRIWDATSGAPGVTFEAPGTIFVGFSRDGMRLFTASLNKTPKIWDVASGQLVAALEIESGAMSIAINRDGTRVVTGSADGIARVWQIGWSAARTIDAGREHYDAAFSPDGKRIATTEQNRVRTWSASGALEGELVRLPIFALQVAFDRDGQQIAAIARGGPAMIGTLAPLTLRPLERAPYELPYAETLPGGLTGHMPPRGAFSPDGTRFATAIDDARARIWDCATRQPVTQAIVHDAAVTTIRFSPDGRRVLTASFDGTARRWDARTAAPIDPPLVHPAGANVTSAVWSPDGKRIATVASDDKVRLWDAATGQLVATLSGHANKIIAALFSPDGTLLLTHSTDQSVRLWSVATGMLAVPPLEHADWVMSAAFSPDGTRIVTSSGHNAQLWDPSTGRPLSPPLVHPSAVRTALFSPDGESVLTVAFDGVRSWDVGLDRRSLDDWLRVVRNSSFPQLEDTLERLTAGMRATH